MKTMKLSLALLVLAVAAPAHAGRGASYGSVMDAIATGNGDVIASELERAEFLACAGCVGPVMELLDNPSYQVREAAAWWLTRRPVLSAAVTMQSVARLQGNDPVAAEYAADVVGTFRHPGVLPVLASALQRADFPASTKVAVVRAIGTIADPSGLPAVTAAMNDAAPATRAEAVRAYNELRLSTRTGAEIAPLLADPDTAVRRQAAASIGKFGFAGARAQLENLLLHDGDPLVRRNAAYSIMKLGGAASRAALQQAVDNDPVVFVRSTAQAALSTR